MQDLEARFHARRQRAEIEVRDVGDLGDGARPGRCAAHARDPVDDVDVLRRRLEQMGRDRRHLLPELLRRAPWIAAPRIGPLRLPPVPNAYGVSLVSPWCTVTSSNGDAEELADTSCAVVVSRPCPCDPEPRYTSTRAVGLDADVGRLGAVGTHHALRLDVQADADAEQTTARELLALPDAERVVVEHRRGLLERLGGRDVERAGCPAAACTAARRAAARCGGGARADRCPAAGRGGRSACSRK